MPSIDHPMPQAALLEDVTTAILKMSIITGLAGQHQVITVHIPDQLQPVQGWHPPLAIPGLIVHLPRQVEAVVLAALEAGATLPVLLPDNQTQAIKVGHLMWTGHQIAVPEGTP